jgi:hypothetical protein
MYTVYTKWVAYELRKRGFKIISVQPNPHKPEFDCYLFEDSKALRAVMKEIKTLKRQ